MDRQTEKGKGIKEVLREVPHQAWIVLILGLGVVILAASNAILS